MWKIDKSIDMFDIEEIKYQADMIAGLSNVFELYIANTDGDKNLKNALECLSIQANKHRDDCNNLMQRFSDSK